MAVQLAERVAAWQAAHPGRTPPVDVRPPGLDAPARATKVAKAVVREVLDRQRVELAALDRATLAELRPIFDQAQAELAISLRQWVERVPDGDLRWSAHKYQAALLLARRIRLQLGQALGEVTERSAVKAELLALRHLEEQVARFGPIFQGTVAPVRLDVITALARGDSYIIPRINSSLRRYQALGDTGTSVYEDIRRRLAVDIAKGASVSETVDRMVAEGGPRGLVDVGGGRLEAIPEGLFQRYRYWAERIVRTENASAAGFARREGIKQANKQGAGLVRKWMADASACAVICRPIDGLVEDHGTWPTPRGSIEHEPAHPNCTCTTTAWKDDWPDILGDLDPVFRQLPPGRKD